MIFVHVQLGCSSMANWINSEDISINVYAFSFSAGEKGFHADQTACLTVSDPSHQLGGLLLTAKVMELVKPNKEVDNILREWLLDHNIRDFGYSSMQD